MDTVEWIQQKRKDKDPADDVDQQSLKLEKKSVDVISHMLKRNQQKLSFKCVPVAELQTTKEVLVIKRDFRISAEDESSRQRFQQKRIAVKE
ncbi:hypothetical protein F511_08858 [Dorcoceras hygrometricum]|uniref:Uncharacterized protein n=1 Tax=Dorcoceras hygrometricum TaxID=472368 RepID=A0A2Z7ANC7_9LAMI|nr:hypothetical protein F511_08858 [Dorcoceras hygrometricum]